MLVKEKRELWKQQHPSIKKWLDNLKAETQERYITYAYRYFMWIETEAPEPYRGKSPEQLLDMQDLCVRQRERFAQVDLLQTWITKREGAYKTKQLIKSTIYSFYAANRVPLPRDQNFKIQGDRASVNGFLSVEEIRQIILSSNELYQAVFTIMWQGAMGESEFEYFNTHSWSQVKEQLDQGKQIIRVDLPGRKHNRMKPSGNYFTFFGFDGITKLKKYLELRKRLEVRETRSKRQPNRKKQREIPSIEQAIFINEKYKPISKEDISSYFKRHAWRLGIIKKVEGDKRIRYRAHVHEMRDTFRTEWSLTEAKGFMSEFFMGHVVDPNKYNKIMQRPKWAEEQYRLAEPFLNILSEDPRTIETKDINKIVDARVQEKVVEIEHLKEQVQQLIQTQEEWEEKIKKMGLFDAVVAEVTKHIDKLLEDPKYAEIALKKPKKASG